MKFSDVLSALAAGKRVRRRDNPAVYALRSDGILAVVLDYKPPHDMEPSRSANLLADDWYVVPEEPAKDSVAEAWKQDALHWMGEAGRLERELSAEKSAYAELRKLAEHNARIMSAVERLVELPHTHDWGPAAPGSARIACIHCGAPHPQSA